MTKQREKQNITLWLLLGCGLALRLVLALVTEGYPYDMSCFVAWGDKLAAEGPAAVALRLRGGGAGLYHSPARQSRGAHGAGAGGVHSV